MDDLIDTNGGQDSKPSPEPSVNKPSRPVIALAGAFLFCAGFAFLWPMVRYQFWQSDTYWLIEIGRLILETQSLPQHDPYSFTSSAPHWIIYQWGAEVIFALANKIGGLTGVAFLGEALLAMLFGVIILRRLLKLGMSPVPAMMAIFLSAYAFYPDLSSLRPQLFSFLLFWLLLEVCSDVKTGMPPWKVLPLTFIIAVVWANCHLSFPIGLVVLGAQLVGSLVSYLRTQSSKTLPVMFAAMTGTFLAATLVTPYGLSLWSLIFNAHNLYYSQEVKPLNWLAEPRWLAFGAVVALACVWLRKKIDGGDLLSLLGLVYTGTGCGRLIVYFCIFSCPLMGQALTNLLVPVLKSTPIQRFNEAIKVVAGSNFYIYMLLAISACCVISQPLFLRRNVPVAAAMYLADHPIQGHLFCTGHAGSYLIYTSRGAIPVFMDTRIDLYDTPFFNRCAIALYNAEGWKELFAQYKVTTALLQNYLPLKYALDKEPDWPVVYKDSDFTLYTHNSPRP